MLTNISYYTQRPTYAGMPVEEHQDYTKALATEYDVTRDATDKLDAALASITPAFDGDRKYLQSVKDNLRTSLDGIAKDVKGGTRFETARAKVRELVSMVNNDTKIAKIKENAERAKLLEKTQLELNAKGHPTLVFKNDKNFSSINPDGTLNDLQAYAQPKGDWEGKKFEIISRVKPKIDPFFNDELENYVKYGIVTKQTKEMYDNVKNQMVNTYLDTQEGYQQFQNMTENEGMDYDSAFNKLGDIFMQSAYLGTYEYEQANYQLKPRNEMDDWIFKQRFAQSLKQPKAGAVQPNAEDTSGYFINSKTLDVIPGIDKGKYDIDESKFDKGKLKDEIEELDGSKNVGPITGLGSTAGTMIATKKVKTTKERQIIDDARKFLIANGIPAMNDQDVMRKMKHINQIGYGRTIQYPNSTIKEELIKSGALLTKDKIPLDLPAQVRVVGSKGDTKSLKDIGINKHDDIVSVNFEGFNVMYDKANKERPGDLLYTINTKDGKSYRVIQDLEAVSKPLANKLSPYEQLLKPLYEDDLSIPSNITKGEKFNAENQLINMNTIVPHVAADLVKLLPVKSYNKSTGKLEYTLNPMIDVNGKWYKFTQQQLDVLTQNGEIKPAEKDTLDDLMLAFKLKSNGNEKLNYDDILRSMRNDLYSDDFVKGAVLNAKAKNTIQVQSNLFNQQVEE